MGCNAKNNLHNCCGFSPKQLVFGYKPSLPSKPRNKLLAMKGSTREFLRSHLNVVSDSRREFIVWKASQKL